MRIEVHYGASVDVEVICIQSVWVPHAWKRILATQSQCESGVALVTHSVSIRAKYQPAGCTSTKFWCTRWVLFDMRTQYPQATCLVRNWLISGLPFPDNVVAHVVNAWKCRSTAIHQRYACHFVRNHNYACDVRNECPVTHNALIYCSPTTAIAWRVDCEYGHHTRWMSHRLRPEKKFCRAFTGLLLRSKCCVFCRSVGLIIPFLLLTSCLYLIVVLRCDICHERTLFLCFAVSFVTNTLNFSRCHFQSARSPIKSLPESLQRYCLERKCSLPPTVRLFITPDEHEGVLRANTPNSRSQSVSEAQGPAESNDSIVNPSVDVSQDDIDHLRSVTSALCKYALEQQSESSPRVHQLRVISEHLLHLRGGQDHVNAVWNFVTSLVLRSSYLDAKIGDSKYVVHGFDKQLETGLRQLKAAISKKEQVLKSGATENTGQQEDVPDNESDSPLQRRNSKSYTNFGILQTLTAVIPTETRSICLQVRVVACFDTWVTNFG